MSWLWMSAAAGCAAVATGLLLPLRPALVPASAGARPFLLLMSLGAGLVTLPLMSPQVACVVIVVCGCLGGMRALLARRLRRKAIAAGQARVLAFCQLLAAELAAGQPPATALARGAAEWPQLTTVASAFDLGGDVSQALRSASRAPGQADLVLVAAAWQVAHQSGGGLSAAMTRVAMGLRATQATRRVVGAELSSARATARLMAGLPVAALLMGRGIGADPLSFLIGSTAGLICLGGGLAFGFAGLWWIEAIADGAS